MQLVTTKELINVMSKELGITLVESEEYLDKLLTCIKRSLSIGDEVRLEGFGKFSSRLRPKQKYRGSKRSISDVHIDILFEQFGSSRKELVEMSVLKPLITKEVEWVSYEPSPDGRSSEQRDAGQERAAG